MKIDLKKLANAGIQNLKASVELLNALDVIKRFVPPEDMDDEPLVVQVPSTSVKAITDGKTKKAVKLTKARKAQLQKQAKKMQKWLKANKEQCPHCKEMIDPRSIKRHKEACKKLKGAK